jgi:hypothetical protein
MNYRIKFEEPKKEDIYAGDCKFQYARILLSNLGLLNPDTISRVAILEHSPSFLQEIKTLDQLPVYNSSLFPFLSISFLCSIWSIPTTLIGFICLFFYYLFLVNEGVMFFKLVFYILTKDNSPNKKSTQMLEAVENIANSSLKWDGL